VVTNQANPTITTSSASFLAELLGASDYVALLAGTVVSGLRMLWVAVRQRRLDPFALFLLALFGAGLVLSFFTGDARFILAKDSTMSCTAGLVLVGVDTADRARGQHLASTHGRRLRPLDSLDHLLG
jgi:hypothetical protein